MNSLLRHPPSETYSSIDPRRAQVCCQPRCRDIEQLEDRHDTSRRYANAKRTPEGQKLSEKAKNAFIFWEILGRSQEETMKRFPYL